MADYHFFEIALGICMKVYEKAIPRVPRLEASIMIGDIDDSHGGVNLILKQSDKLTTFAVISIDVTELEMENTKLIIEVIAKKEEHEIGDIRFDNLVVESILRDYEKLKPIVKEGIIHYNDSTESRKASREFEVRFRAFFREYDITEDFDYEYDKDEIGEAAVPYVIALREIHSKLHSKEKPHK